MGCKHRHLVLGNHGKIQIITLSLEMSADSHEYCHLLEARMAIDEPGIYESVEGGNGKPEDIAHMIRLKMARDFDLLDCSYYHDALKGFDKATLGGGTTSWTTRLLDGAIPADEVSFVLTVLNPDPTERWTAEEIIRCGFLDALREPD